MVLQGIIDQYYIIEVEVFPWNPDHELAVTSLTRVQPLFRNDENLYFIRGLGVMHQVKRVCFCAYRQKLSYRFLAIH